jgi:hypothetical protein
MDIALEFLSSLAKCYLERLSFTLYTRRCYKAIALGRLRSCLLLDRGFLSVIITLCLDSDLPLLK